MNNFNAEISQNVFLRNIRRYKKISIFRAGIMSHVGILTLFNIERGYWSLSKRVQKKLENYYKLDTNKLSNYNPVPTPVKVKLPKKESFMTKIFRSRITIIFFFFLTIIFTIATPNLIHRRDVMKDDYDNYLPLEYVKFRENIINRASDKDISSADQGSAIYSCKNGLTFTDNFLVRTSLNYLYDFDVFEKDGITYEGAVIISGVTRDKASDINYEKDKPAVISFISSLKDGEKNYAIQLTYRGGSSTMLQGQFAHSIDSESDKFVDLVFYEEVDGIEFVLGTDPDLSPCVEFCKNETNKLMTGINAYIKDRTNCSSFEEFYSNVLKGVFEYSDKTVSLWYGYVFSTFAAIIFGGLTIFTLLNRFSYKTEDKYDELPRDRCAITKNWRFSPPIKEGYYKILGLLFMAFSCWSVYVIASKFNMLIFLNIDFSQDFVVFLNNYSSLFKLAPLIIIVFTTKNYIRNEKPYFVLLIFLMLTLFYFFLELYLIKRVTEATVLTYFEPFLKYIPSNFFFSILILMSFATFLFRTPSILNKKWKIIVYRSQSILVVIIFIISFTIRLLSKKGIISLSLEANYILPEKLFGAELFGILFIFGMYIFETVIRKKKGTPYLKQFKETNAYYWIENIIIIALILFITGFENIPFFVNEMGKIGVGKLKNAYIIAPLFLFYHPRIEPLDGKVAVGYTLGLIFGMMLPYAILAFNILIFLSL